MSCAISDTCVSCRSPYCASLPSRHPETDTGTDRLAPVTRPVLGPYRQVCARTTTPANRVRAALAACEPKKLKASSLLSVSGHTEVNRMALGYTFEKCPCERRFGFKFFLGLQMSTRVHVERHGPHEATSTRRLTLLGRPAHRMRPVRRDR